jgi:proteasome accessory factor C
MPDDGPSAAQLQRLLYLLPRASGPEPVSLEALARAAGSTPEEVFDDLFAVSTRSFYRPAGFVDDLLISVEENEAWVSTGGEFGRPVRLTAREAFALGTGLRILADGASGEQATEIRALARRVEDALAAAMPDKYRDGRPAEDAEQPLDRLRTGLAAVADGDPTGIRAVVLAAAAERRRCRIAYAKPAGCDVEEREVEPYVVVFAGGFSYALGRCVRADDIRAFRLDRIVRAAAGEERFEVPEGFDPDRYFTGGRLYWAADEAEVVVRYSPRVARWIVERGEAEPQVDGGVVVRHQVADPGWIVRHVLQYGADAELLEPAELRDAVREAAERALARGGEGALH